MQRAIFIAILLFVLCAAQAYASIPKSIIDLGSPNVATLMTHPQVADGDTTSASIGGLTCRQNVNSSEDFYFFFGIDDSFAYQGSRTDMYITIHYYDTGTGNLSLEYDSASNSYAYGGGVALTNTNKWKNYTWHVTDGYFGNRQNGGADFRIAGPGSGKTFYLDLVYARDFCGPNPRVRVHPSIGHPNFDGRHFRAMMENPSQWPVTRGMMQVLSYYDNFGPYSDSELSSWLAQISSWGLKLFLETGAVKDHTPDSEALFNWNRPTYDRIYNLGGTLDGLVMDEPFTAVRGWHLGTDDYAVNETADWIRLVRQNYSGLQIGSIEAYPFISQSSLQWWLTSVQDRCAQLGVEGLDYFIVDCDWRTFPNGGNWNGVKALENFCDSKGIPFSLIYTISPHAGSTNDADFYADVMAAGNYFRNVGGTPNEYCVQSWDPLPNYYVPEDGNYTFTRVAHDFVNQFVPRVQSPYNGVVTLPGTVQAEDYDRGGEGVSYHDTSIGNYGGATRLDQSVDIEYTSDTTGTYNVAFIDSTEWIEYTVNVASTGTYNINARLSSPNSGGTFHIEMNGANVTGTQSIPNTGGWQNWTTVTVSNVSLSAGQQTMKVVFDNAAGGCNINYVNVAVAANINNAQVISDTIPTTMTAGQQYSVSVTMKNTGSTTWTADGTNAYKLGGVGDSDPFYNPPTNPPYRVLLNPGETVAPNAQRTFTFTMTAPSTPGSYTTDWRMVREWIEWFGGTLTKQVQVNPAAPVTFSTSSFDADANGWAISLWHSGQYTDGTMAWNSGAGRTGGGIRTIGSGSSDNTDRCTREGGELQKTISTVGYNSISVSYDLRVNTLGGNYTGTGSGSCGVDHNIIDEQLTVYYSTNGGTNWIEAEYITRGSLLGYTSYGTRTINLAGVSACNNNANFRLRFRWQVNGTSDTVDLDNIKVTGTP